MCVLPEATVTVSSFEDCVQERGDSNILFPIGTGRIRRSWARLAASLVLLSGVCSVQAVAQCQRRGQSFLAL